MGISIHGLLVNMSGDRVPGMLEQLFKREIVATKSSPWDWYAQFDMPDGWDIAVMSKGNNSAIYFGYSFFMTTNQMFPRNSIKHFPEDYLYYCFVESSMDFILSHRKDGRLYEVNYFMDGDEYVFHGDTLFGLTIEHDIAQDGLDLALAAFNLDPNEIGQVSIYTFSSEIKKARITDKDLRYFIGKSSRELYQIVREKKLNFREHLATVTKQLAERDVQLKAINLSLKTSLEYAKKWKLLSQLQRGELESRLIDQVILMDAPEDAFAQLIYLCQFNHYLEAKAALMRSIIPVIVGGVIILVVAFLIFLKYS